MRNIKTPGDIQSLPNYVAKVDPEATPLNRIIDYYYIRPDIQCALCGKWHLEGCIVELVDKFKSVTNIGHICGGKFGEKFAEERRKFSESVRRPELTKKLVEGASKVSAMSLHLESLKHRANLASLRTDKFAKLFPSVYRQVARLAINNQAAIYESLERTKDEIDEAHAANPHVTRESLRIKEEYRGAIKGYKSPSMDWSFGNGVRKVFIEANKFTELIPRTMTMQDLTKWANWYDDFDEALRYSTTAIEQGEEFFSKENFVLFCYLPGAEEFHTKLKSLRANDLDMAPLHSPQMSYPTALPKSSILPRTKPTITIRELRRLTGNKKIS